MSPAEVVHLDDERNAVFGEASSRAELCLEEESFLVNEGEEPPSLRIKKVRSMKRKL